MKDITELVRETLFLREDQISDDTLIERIARDSMDVVELIAVLSSEYKISIQPEDINNIKTVGDIKKFVAERQGTAQTKDSLDAF